MLSLRKRLIATAMINCRRRRLKSGIFNKIFLTRVLEVNSYFASNFHILHPNAHQIVSLETTACGPLVFLIRPGLLNNGNRKKYPKKFFSPILPKIGKKFFRFCHNFYMLTLIKNLTNHPPLEPRPLFRYYASDRQQELVYESQRQINFFRKFFKKVRILTCLS